MVDNYTYPLTESGTFKQYEIENELGEGYRGKTYKASTGGKSYVIKLPNLDVARPKDQIQSRLNEIQKDVIREWEAWKRISTNPAIQNHVAEIVEVSSALFAISDTNYLVPYIIQEYIPGQSLEEWCKSNYGDPFSGITASGDWFEWSTPSILE